jgi:nitrogen fixation-related uncharacterized protein
MKKPVCIFLFLTVFSTFLWAGGKKDTEPAAA